MDVKTNVQFKAGQISSDTEKLYKKLLIIYTSGENTENANELKARRDELRKKYTELAKEEKIIVSFIGQYSSGKSTIIKALTGDNDIVIDSDIATGKVTTYEWGGVLLNDTPGLKTGEREEHDAMTLEAVKHSDLLMYCITSDLFSNITKADFKNFAKDYRSKLFLVINKMNSESGEYEELVNNYTDTINRTLAPEYSISDFFNFFIDVKDYLKGYTDDSYFLPFIDKLNDFIKSRGLNGKLQTPLNILKNSVDETLISVESNEHLKEGKILINKICNLIQEKKRLFVKICNEDVQRTANKFIHKGDDVAAHLGSKGYEFNDEAFQEFSGPLQEELSKNIESYFKQYASEIDVEVQKIMDSEMASHFFEEQKLKLNKKYKGGNNSSEILGTIEQGIGQASSAFVPKAEELLLKFTNIPAGGKATIWNVNGSNLHKIIKNIGSKLGYKFKPFQAVKLTQKIANITQKLGPFLTGAATFMELLGILMEKWGEKKVRKLQDDIKSVFKDASEGVVTFYNRQIDTAAEEFDSVYNTLENELMNLEQQSIKNNDFVKQLKDIRSEITALINTIN